MGFGDLRFGILDLGLEMRPISSLYSPISILEEGVGDDISFGCVDFWVWDEFAGAH
jgi:hypothetical protein